MARPVVLIATSDDRVAAMLTPFLQKEGFTVKRGGDRQNAAATIVDDDDQLVLENGERVAIRKPFHLATVAAHLRKMVPEVGEPGA
jgi:hypothetical protein